mmetsp:Transcript_71156/g.161024  ORF Transcript_71156/g.161024 Transcript_71156/m.161024 type:complete len:785 (+) Transcript_71156:176-2530(+)
MSTVTNRHVNANFTPGGSARATASPNALSLPRPKTPLRHKLFLAATTWGIFFATWAITTLILFQQEKEPEKTSVHKFHDEWGKILDTDDDQMEANVQDFLDFMVDEGDCTIPNDRNDRSWTIGGAFFFTFTLSTTIGYGTFASSTNMGRFVTSLYAFLTIPIFIHCSTTMTDVMEHVVNFVPGCPRGNSTLDRIRRVKFRLAFFTFLLVFWLGVGGGLLTPAVTRQGWSFFDGVYFSYISISTIGLGDYVFDPSVSKGLILIYVTIGLAIFSTFLTVLNRTINLLMLDFSTERDLSKVMAWYTEEELRRASAGFSAMDLGKSNNLPRGFIETWQLRDFLFLTGIETDVDIEHKIDELVWLHDKSFSDRFGVSGWYLIFAPLLTNFGQRQEARRQLREVSLSWVAVVIALVIGAQIMVWCESDHEEETLRNFEDLVLRHRDGMNEEQEESLTTMVETLTGNGICSIPECAVYEANEPNLFKCKEYHRVWDFPSAFFFMFTMFTTIGYGSYTPQTSSGRTFACVLSLFGIVLMGFAVGTLTDLPQLIRDSFRKHGQGGGGGGGGGGKFKKKKKKNIKHSTNSTLKSPADGPEIEDELDLKEDENANEANMPSITSPTCYEKVSKTYDRYESDLKMFLIMMAYLFAAGWFYVTVVQSEDSWPYLFAVYFLWISFSTVGLGDFAPSEEHTWAAMPIIIIGLALAGYVMSAMAGAISNTIAIVQEDDPETRIEKALANAKGLHPNVEDEGMTIARLAKDGKLLSVHEELALTNPIGTKNPVWTKAPYKA